MRSHTLAEESTNKGYLSDIAPVNVPNRPAPVTRDLGIRVGTMEKLSSLKAAFIKPHGTVTAANASCNYFFKT